MKNTILSVMGAFCLSTAASAIDLREDPATLSQFVQSSYERIAYTKGAIIHLKKDIIIEEVFFPTADHHNLNFERLAREAFGEAFGPTAWFPQAVNFDDLEIDALLGNYKYRIDENKDPRSIFFANLLYKAGIDLYNNRKNSDFLEKAASLGHSGAQHKLFSISYRNHKYQEAKNYLFSAAAQKNPQALVMLSEIFYPGYDNIVPWKSENVSLARKLCEEAARLGNPDAIFTLRVATLMGGYFNNPVNYQGGIRQLKVLSDEGNPEAQLCLNAIMKSSGDGIMEGNENVTYDDLDFLKEFLGWKGEEEFPLESDDE